jgi:hypothetical protein
MKSRPCRIREEHGLTLVETMVALLISLGVLTVIAMLSMSSIKSFFQGTAMDQGQQLGDAAYGFIEDCLDDALGVSLVRAGESGPADFTQAIYISDGVLYYQKSAESAAFAPIDAELYQGGSLTYSASISNDVFYLRVEVLDRHGKTTFVRDSSFRLMNVSMGAGKGASDLAGGTADPRICFIQNQAAS